MAVKYFSRFEGFRDYAIVMRVEDRETVVSTARSEASADKKAARLQSKEDDARYNAMSEAEKDSFIGRHIVGAPPKTPEPYISSAESNNCEQDEGA